ncbi:MAG TPA: MFS transporter [Acidothermaceae bacterium]|jgi:MFS family permease|nr:MFS transporter [Acidothermaceae bacterium]
MNRVFALSRQTFAALAIPNFRRYFTGQAISLIGTWMQTVAQSWLIFKLTGSATDVGWAVALQTLPVLVLGPYGGVVADRIDKRKLMMALQAMMGVLALVLGVLVVTNNIHVWEVFGLAFLLGLNNCFENPARQSFVLEMVGQKDLRNAVSLNSTLVNAARAVGAAMAGIVIALGGIGICFLLNGVSFAAVVYSLASMDVTKLRPTLPTTREKGQLRAGIHYAATTVAIGVPLVMMALVGCLAYEFQVVLPALAKTFHGGGATYGFLTAAMGVGAIFGGLYTAARGRTGVRAMVTSSAVFGVVLLLASVAPTLPLELVALLIVGAASVSFLSKGNSSLQLAAAPQMRGRVMALWAVAFLGSTPIGGPIAGAVSEYFGARWGLVLGASACLLAAAFGALVLRRVARSDADGNPHMHDATEPALSAAPAAG